MSEQEIMEKIKRSADDLAIPEQLSPDSMQQKLMELQQIKREKRKNYYMISGAVAMAACMMLAFVSGFLSHSYKSHRRADAVAALENENAVSNEAMQRNESGSDGSGDSGNFAGSAEPDLDETEESGRDKPEKKQDAGNLYTVAKDYGEVYDHVFRVNSDETFRYSETGQSDRDSAAVEEAGEIGTGSDSGSLAVKEETVMDDMAASDTSAAAKGGYTKTNLQTEGVDESDIVKTDGSYIYTVTDNQVVITDVTKKDMRVAGTIDVSLQGASDYVAEMYVDGDTINLILQREVTDLKVNAQKKYKTLPLEEGMEDAEDLTGEKDIEAEDGSTYYIEGEDLKKFDDYDLYYLDTVYKTELLTYDVSDRKKPKLQGLVTQDGFYQTSRKIADVVYLFTEKGMSGSHVERETAMTEEQAGGWIPIVNGEVIAADCIYLPKEPGSQGLIVSSVNVKKPDQVIDKTMVINNDVQVYMGKESVYLYNNDYSSGYFMTKIAKFSLDNGIIGAVGAASVNGEMKDTFAINDNQGKLRVLTTDQSQGEDVNQLTLFDEEMNLTGKLENIAKGEQIYAARFLGNMAYFVTYRNTDPLFAVDLTDEKNPVILSELKITGFSEYLHFWGEDKLLGIGYETDEHTGERKGMKLTMFDISNPADLKTINTCVIENTDYSPVLYQYKCVLADEKENLIGFATETYVKNHTGNYLLFSWADGKFVEQMAQPVNDDYRIDQLRGIYIGDRFYLVYPTEINSFDRSNGYQWIQKLTLSEKNNENTIE